MSESNDKILFKKFASTDEYAFETLFHQYYKSLCVYASTIVKDEHAAEEVVQDLFVKLWEKRKTLEIKTSVKNYLIRSIKNQCLNIIKHNKIKNTYTKNILSDSQNNPTTENNFIEIDLIKKIQESINSLPAKRQTIFRLSREEGLKYREIAEKLNISVKTVETQMGLAIKTLREKLKDYKTFYTLICILKTK